MQYNARKMKHNKRKKIIRSGEAETVSGNSKVRIFCCFLRSVIINDHQKIDLQDAP